MEGFAVRRASELIVGEPTAEVSEFTIYSVPVTLNLRDFSARPTPTPRIVHYYFASDADGLVFVEGPGGEDAGSVLFVADLTGVLDIDNVSDVLYTGRLVVQTQDGVVVSAPLNIPGAIDLTLSDAIDFADRPLNPKPGQLVVFKSVNTTVWGNSVTASGGGSGFCMWDGAAWKLVGKGAFIA